VCTFLKRWITINSPLNNSEVLMKKLFACFFAFFATVSNAGNIPNDVLAMLASPSAVQVPMYATGNSITVTYIGYDASYTDSLYNDKYGTNALFVNKTSTPNSTVTVNGYSPGEAIRFKLGVDTNLDSNTDYFIPSDTFTKAVYFNGLAYIGFEDIKSGNMPGGDKDFNDFVFRVNNVSVAPIPEPSTYIMMLAGLLGIAVLRKRMM